ncbi:heme-binding protein 2 isoform X3 [Cynocephalus volans]|uniref:heme-binding protein 2 isoform X3 n=1 Tax=Cynocephalus volans TaxID=110931 RepID=UPI002FC8FB3B
MAELEPDPGAVETPGWKAPEAAGPQPGSYEIRHYGPAKWVSTSVESMDWDSAVQIGFTKLNSYLQGKNEKEMKIKMTAPVTSYVEPGSSPFSESTITISLYIPSEQQSDPPRPSESDVFIEDRAEMTVFVRNPSLLPSTREAFNKGLFLTAEQMTTDCSSPCSGNKVWPV